MILDVADEGVMPLPKAAMPMLGVVEDVVVDVSFSGRPTSTAKYRLRHRKATKANIGKLITHTAINEKHFNLVF